MVWPAASSATARTWPAGCASSMPMPCSVAKTTRAAPWRRPASNWAATPKPRLSLRRSPNAWGSVGDAQQRFSSMTRKERRAVTIAAGVAILGVAVFLMLFALRDTIVFFHTPKEVVERQVPAGRRIRLGGLVAEASVKRGLGETVDF